MGNGNPADIEDAIYGWLNKQSFPVVTLSGAAQGAAFGGIMGFFHQAKIFAGGPLIMARSFAAMMGAHDGISCMMRRFTGNNDFLTSMVAAFGSGVAFAVGSGGLGPKGAASAVAYALCFALVQGGTYKAGGDQVSKPPTENVYGETGSMLSRLDLESYEKNFKKALLTDYTLPLLNNSVPRDASIPRLLILDHIQRNKVATEGGRRS